MQASKHETNERTKGRNKERKKKERKERRNKAYFYYGMTDDFRVPCKWHYKRCNDLFVRSREPNVRMTKFFLAYNHVYIRDVTLRAFMGIKVALLEDHGTAEIQLHSQIFVTRSAKAGPCQNGCSQFFSSIFLPYFLAQQIEFPTVPKNPPTHPNIGHVSAQQREWYVLEQDMPHNKL